MKIKNETHQEIREYLKSKGWGTSKVNPSDPTKDKYRVQLIPDSANKQKEYEDSAIKELSEEDIKKLVSMFTGK